MEIKLFGKSLFKFKKGDQIQMWVDSAKKESKYLPDFYKSFNEGFSLNDYEVISDISGKIAGIQKKNKKVKVTEKVEEKVKLTPKGVYELKLLNDTAFVLNTNPEYVDKQISDFKDKLNLLKSEEYDMRRGVEEVISIVMRFENRKKYSEVKDFFDEYPYTTSSKIADLVKSHNHLQIGQIAQFVADMPKEAIDAMKAYNKHTQQICKKDAVFYIIADKKDFKKTDKRRDPILLAQSPFGHFWQILGAWDDEMLLLENL